MQVEYDSCWKLQFRNTHQRFVQRRVSHPSPHPRPFLFRNGLKPCPIIAKESKPAAKPNLTFCVLENALNCCTGKPFFATEMGYGLAIKAVNSMSFDREPKVSSAILGDAPNFNSLIVPYSTCDICIYFTDLCKIQHEGLVLLQKETNACQSRNDKTKDESFKTATLQIVPWM